MADRHRLPLLAGLALAAVAAFLTVGLKGDLAFALELRAVRLAAIVQVAVAVAVSTVVFQTVTANRILTPSIMGLDALYALGQTALVFTLGGLGFAAVDPNAKFVVEAALLAAAAVALFLPLLRATADLPLLLLLGVVAGALFRSLGDLLSRLMDPNLYAVAQIATVASFADVDPALLAAAGLVTTLASLLAWRAQALLDVVALGRDAAIGLGVDHGRTVFALLVLVAVLVAVSTALVGPVSFLGLVVVATAEAVVNTRRHRILLPAAVLVAIAALAAGETILRQAATGVTLGIVIELVGGLVFLVLLMRVVPR